MPRASRSVAKRARHKKWIKRAKGYRGRRSQVFKLAKEAVLKAGQHAYNDRRKKKGVQRAQWHRVINAAARQHDVSYSRLTHMLREQNVELDRKVLAQLALEQPEMFGELIKDVTTSKQTASTAKKS